MVAYCLKTNEVDAKLNLGLRGIDLFRRRDNMYQIDSIAERGAADFSIPS